MNSKHLAAGSELPPLQDGKLRIYNMRHCPFGQRILLVVAAKEIPVDIVNVSLISKPEWLFQRNPTGKVPTIETSKGPLYESLILAEYLDEIYPNRKLVPTDPYQKALDKIWIENSSKIITLQFKLIFGIIKDDESVTKERLKEYIEALAPFEVELKRRGTTFFSGLQPGLLDYMIWPWFERLPVLKIFIPDLHDFKKAKSQNPNLENWRKAMKVDDAVKASYLSPQVHHQYILSHLAGSPNYDLL